MISFEAMMTQEKGFGMDENVESLATPGYAFLFKNWKGELDVFTPLFLAPKAQRNIGLFVIYVAM